jgi:hypothetical protein
MFKSNKHRFNNYILLIILFEFRYKILILFQNSPFLHKTLSRPSVRRPATLIWVARPEFGNPWSRVNALSSLLFIAKKSRIARIQLLDCTDNHGHCSLGCVAVWSGTRITSRLSLHMPWRGMEVWMYRSTLSYPRQWVQCLADHPSRFTYGIRRKEAGWDPKPVWTLWGREGSLILIRNRTTTPWSSNPLLSLYTDWHIAVPLVSERLMTRLGVLPEARGTT